MNCARKQIGAYVDAVTEFFLSHRGRCFEGWDLRRIRAYVGWHFLNGTLFVVGRGSFQIEAVAIAWAQNATAIRLLDSLGLPQFVWQSLPEDGDAILVADVCGSRIMMAEIVKQVMAHWPDSPRKKLFTYRRGKLVELSWKKILRFARGGLHRGHQCGDHYHGKLT